jgi:hypothetical protein
MKREAYILKSSEDGRRHICIDVLNEQEILEFMEEDPTRSRKFRDVISFVLSGLRNSDIYSKEDIDKNAKDVYAMKMFKGGQNIRIYCKEQREITGSFYIIMSELLKKKKDQKAEGKSKKLIQIVSNYEYFIIDRPE